MKCINGPLCSTRDCPYGCGVLTFDDLRDANMRRVIVFKNKQGELAHGSRGVYSWTPAEWLQATVGELGEAANLMKKLLRGDYAAGEEYEAAREALAHEFADVAIYLDLLAARFGVDLGAAIRKKFNIVSDRVGCDIKL